jgi:hypothetical protein
MGDNTQILTKLLFDGFLNTPVPGASKLFKLNLQDSRPALFSIRGPFFTSEGLKYFSDRLLTSALLSDDSRLLPGLFLSWPTVFKSHQLTSCKLDPSSLIYSALGSLLADIVGPCDCVDPASPAEYAFQPLLFKDFLLGIIPDDDYLAFYTHQLCWQRFIQPGVSNSVVWASEPFFVSFPRMGLWPQIRDITTPEDPFTIDSTFLKFPCLGDSEQAQSASFNFFAKFPPFRVEGSASSWSRIRVKLVDFSQRMAALPTSAAPGNLIAFKSLLRLSTTSSDTQILTYAVTDSCPVWPSGPNAASNFTIYRSRSFPPITM